MTAHRQPWGHKVAFEGVSPSTLRLSTEESHHAGYYPDAQAGISCFTSDVHHPKTSRCFQHLRRLSLQRTSVGLVYDGGGLQLARGASLG